MRSRTKMAIAQRAAKKPASKTPVVQAVADYIAGQLEATQVALAQVRSAIRKAIPRAEEVIAYKIPAYKLDGEIVLYFAGWKRHYSLYPAGEHLVEAFQHQLARYELSKGTIRFPLSEPVPAKLIEQIAKFRAREVSRRKI